MCALANCFISLGPVGKCTGQIQSLYACGLFDVPHEETQVQNYAARLTVQFVVQRTLTRIEGCKTLRSRYSLSAPEALSDSSNAKTKKAADKTSSPANLPLNLMIVRASAILS